MNDDRIINEVHVHTGRKRLRRLERKTDALLEQGERIEEKLDLILITLVQQGDAMSDLTGAVDRNTEALSAMNARVAEDVANLQSLLDQAVAEAQAAAANDVADAAAIADLNSRLGALQDEAATVVERINANTATLAGIDPDTSFPAAPEGGGEEVPTDVPGAGEPADGTDLGGMTDGTPQPEQPA